MDVALRDERDFAGVIKLRLLRWRDYPGLSRGVQLQGPSKRNGQAAQSQEKEIRSQKRLE